MTESRKPKIRDSWGSRIGVILAVAGSAVGLGNFLRFPVQAVENGGGAFMVPYIIALLVLGIPLSMVEWSLGRYGGRHEHGGGPGVYNRLTHGRPWAKYLGVITIAIPMLIVFYYLYIAGWALAFSFFSISGTWNQAIASQEMGPFLASFIGAAENQYFSGPWTAIAIFLLVFAINYFILYKGISKGIEALAKYGMPILLVMGIVLAVRVLTLGTPNPAHPDWNVNNALGFMWNPDWSRLVEAKVWIAAAGQIFFTLSVGMGCIMTYASYLKPKDDVALSSVTAASTNEFAEVILGGSVAVVASAVFMGVAGAQAVAEQGAFNLGFVTMPYIFAMMGGTGVLGFLWFFLLFIAAITSSVSLIQPLITFFKDELDMSHGRALVVTMLINLLVTGFIIMTIAHGTLDEMDFWAGTVMPVVSGLIMVLLYVLYLKVEKGWDELHHGALIRIPTVFKYIIKYVTPLYLILILGVWLYQDWLPLMLMKDKSPEQIAWLWGTRVIIVGFFIFLAVLVYQAGKRGKFTISHREAK
jgi:NSS family neurotransmitter:Na+ symporter